MKKVFSLLMMLALFFSAQESLADEQHIAIQMPSKVEKSAVVPLTIFFKEKPENNPLELPTIAGIILDAGSKNIIDGLSETNEGDAYPYAYHAYVKTTETGDISFPALEVTQQGKQYQSAPFNIQVVDIIKLEPDDLLLKLSTDRNKLKVGEHVMLTLDLYSTFPYVIQEKNYGDQAVIKQEEGAIKIAQGIDLDKLTGIKGLTKTLENYFDITDFYYNKDQSSMSEINKKRYFKREIVQFTLTAKKEGLVTLSGDALLFNIYTDNQKYFSKFSGTDNALKLKVRPDEPIQIEIKK